MKKYRKGAHWGEGGYQGYGSQCRQKMRSLSPLMALQRSYIWYLMNHHLFNGKAMLTRRSPIKPVFYRASYLHCSTFMPKDNQRTRFRIDISIDWLSDWVMHCFLDMFEHSFILCQFWPLMLNHSFGVAILWLVFPFARSTRGLFAPLPDYFVRLFEYSCARSAVCSVSRLLVFFNSRLTGIYVIRNKLVLSPAIIADSRQQSEHD